MMVLVTAKMKIKRALCVATIAMLFFIIIADSHRPQNRPSTTKEILQKISGKKRDGKSCSEPSKLDADQR